MRIIQPYIIGCRCTSEQSGMVVSDCRYISHQTGIDLRDNKTYYTHAFYKQSRCKCNAMVANFSRTSPLPVCCKYHNRVQIWESRPVFFRPVAYMATFFHSRLLHLKRVFATICHHYNQTMVPQQMKQGCLK